jgi:hypothetical protein
MSDICKGESVSLLAVGIKFGQMPDLGVEFRPDQSLSEDARQ